VPAPPGTKSTSRSGALAKVCVGKMLCAKEELPGVAIRSLVDTGSRVSAISERLIVLFMESRLRASRGPVTSRSSNAGNSM